MNTTETKPLLDYPGCRRQNIGERWIMSVPVISTAHITAEDRARLIDPTEKEGDVLATIVGDAGSIIVIEDGPSEFESFSQPMEDLVSAFRSLGYSYLRLDSDGDEIPSLPTFE